MADELKVYYKGMYLDLPKGNNAFSFDTRQQKKIYIPPLIEGNLHDLILGEEIVFSEVCEGQEINKKGLRHFIYWRRGSQDFFIFDNHNHAFFFWIWGLKTGKILKGSRLVHVDEHSDLRVPAKDFDLDMNGPIDLRKAFDYTNYEINVGNFIKPAIKSGIFSSVDVVNSQESFDQDYPPGIVLDLDMDIFAKEMDYLPKNYKIEKIRQLLRLTSFVTVATSPYFMEQDLALGIIRQIFE